MWGGIWRAAGRAGQWACRRLPPFAAGACGRWWVATALAVVLFLMTHTTWVGRPMPSAVVGGFLLVNGLDGPPWPLPKIFRPHPYPTFQGGSAWQLEGRSLHTVCLYRMSTHASVMCCACCVLCRAVRCHARRPRHAAGTSSAAGPAAILGHAPALPRPHGRGAVAAPPRAGGERGQARHAARR